ncbi:MAG: serine hydroxymethyltransferase [Candidatus Thermoplasmatota archaeon]
MHDSNIASLIQKHEEMREKGLNLIASENLLSDEAKRALSSDLSGRYHSDYYGGTEHIREMIDRTEALAEKLFNVEHAFIKPISGNICDLNVLFSFTNPGYKVAMIPFDNGGYPLGLKKFDRGRIDIPVKEDSYEIDVERAKSIYEEQKADLTILGASYIPFPHPVEAISSFMSEWDRPLIYDGSHVLGLIATGEFQSPLEEGADVLIGSTHKSFYGPQGGLILTDSEEYADKIREYQDIDLDTGIGLVDNPHVNRIAALGITIEEMLEDEEYGKRVVDNAKALASSLDESGVPVRFSEKDYTESHQIFLDMGWETSEKFCKRLEEENIFIDITGRIGVSEVTRRGLNEEDMRDIAEKIASVYKEFEE